LRRLIFSIFFVCVAFVHLANAAEDFSKLAVAREIKIGDVNFLLKANVRSSP